MKKFFFLLVLMVVGYFTFMKMGVFSSGQTGMIFSKLGSFLGNVLGDTRDYVYERANDIKPFTDEISKSVRKGAYQAMRSSVESGVRALGESLGVEERLPDVVEEASGLVEPVIFFEKTQFSTEEKAAVLSGRSSDAAITFCPLYDKGEEIRYAIRVVTATKTEFKAIVDWGDGEKEEEQKVPEGRDLSLAHTYNKSGEFSVVLVIDDGKEKYRYEKSVCIK